MAVNIVEFERVDEAGKLEGFRFIASGDFDQSTTFHPSSSCRYLVIEELNQTGHQTGHCNQGYYKIVNFQFW